MMVEMLSLTTEKSRQLLAERLKHYREKAGLSTAELAKRTNLSNSSIINYERGDGPIPGAAALFAIASTLDVTLQELVGWRERVSVESVWRFQRDMRKYEIDRVRKKTYIALDGSAVFSQRIEGLHNLSNDILKLSHGIQLAPPAAPDPEGNPFIDPTFTWNCEPNSTMKLAVPELVHRENDPKHAFWPVRIPRTDSPISYKFRYRAERAFRMTSVGTTDDEFSKGREYSMFLVTKPVRFLKLEVAFPDGFVPEDVVWSITRQNTFRSQTPNDLPPEDLTSNLFIEEYCTKCLYDIRTRSIGFEVRFAVPDCRYAVSWRGVDSQSYRLLCKNKSNSHTADGE